MILEENRILNEKTKNEVSFKKENKRKVFLKKNHPNFYNVKFV